MLYQSKVIIMNKRSYLYQSFLTLKTEAEVKDYLRDLLTDSEIAEIADRLQIAKMLNEKQKYTAIGSQTEASSRTIARVSKWLKDDGRGYKLVLKRLHHHQSTHL